MVILMIVNSNGHKEYNSDQVLITYTWNGHDRVLVIIQP